QFVGAIDVGLKIGRGQDYHQQTAQIRFGAQPLQHLKTIGAGHLEIEQKKKRQGKAFAIGILASATQIIDRLVAILDDFKSVAQPGFLKSALNEQHVVRVVLSQQNELIIKHV